ncbi:outer membrane protein transport protein [Halosquirtibacter xylanolyticus]|uniref:OmpP1/FadL family transporter n=1 Tax=Halosquirtibacter xylanolyticus TaxID=3374599 RepID=UPI003749D168|nr:outer membrane protein transport protein [Prolixibacteraceae bacterium]
MKKVYSFATKKVALLFALMFIGVTLSAQQGGGLMLYEVATPNIGNANAGQSAVAHDASTAYFNPAAMSEVKDQSWLVGIQGMLPKFNFESTESAYPNDNAGKFTPSLAVYWLKHLSDKWTIGATLNFPMGSSLDYGDNWEGKYYLTKATIAVANIAPAASFKLSEKVSFGVAANFYIGMLSEDIAIPSVITGAPDGEANIDGTSFSMGFQFGFHYRPNSTLSLGLTYRYKSTIDFQGDADATNYFINGEKYTSARYSTDMLIPHGVNFSISKYFGDVELLFDLGYCNWAGFDYQSIILKEEYDAHIERKWQDTYRVGLGGNYFINDKWTVRAGLSFDSSPVDEQYRTPDLPLSGVYRFGAGGTMRINDKFDLSLSYNFMLGIDNDLNQVSNLKGNLIGTYDPTNIHTIAISLGF